MDYRMPFYIQLQDIIIKKIEEKKYLPGEAIPSERKMAEVYGVNRMAVKRAVSKLVEQGYLIRKPGSGTYVAQRDHKKIDLSYMNEASGNTGVTALLRQVGMETSSKVLGIGEITDSKYLNYKLALGKEDKICGLHRVRLADGEPFAIEYTYMPQKDFEDIEKFDFSKVSLYDYMDTKGHMPIHFIQNLVICQANEKVAELLGVERGTAVYKIEYQGADKDYHLVEYTKSYMNPAYAEFRFVAEAK